MIRTIETTKWKIHLTLISKDIIFLYLLLFINTIAALVLQMSGKTKRRRTNRHKKRSKSASKSYGVRRRATRGRHRRKSRRMGKTGRARNNITEMKSDTGKTVGQLINELNMVANQIGRLLSSSTNLAMSGANQLMQQPSEISQGSQMNRFGANRINPYSQSQAA